MRITLSEFRSQFAHALRIVLVLPLALLVGCTAGRITTTERTAVEQALLARSAEDVIRRFDAIPAAPGDGFLLDETALDGPGKLHIAAALKARFMSDGLHLAVSPAPHDATILPRVLISGIDDSECLVGLPSIPIPIPGYATVHLPELALFKLHTQHGRTELGYTAFETQSGRLIADQPPIFSVRTYRRWTVLLFFSFRTGNLGQPF